MHLKRADDTSTYSREPHVRLLPLSRPLPNKGGCRTGPSLWKMLWRARLRFPCGYSLRYEPVASGTARAARARIVLALDATRSW